MLSVYVVANLLVDDNLDAVSLLAKLLSRRRLRGAVYLRPQDALEIAAEFHPEAICLDIGMPVIDGYTLAQSLRQINGLEHCRIIAVSGHPPDRERLNKAGIEMHLLKPVAASVLVDALSGAAS